MGLLTGLPPRRTGSAAATWATAEGSDRSYVRYRPIVIPIG